jgi:hypothetical protein
MSHVVKVNLVIKDLVALREACTQLGIELELLPVEQGNLNPHKFNWWGYSVGNYPLPEGMKAEDIGKCAHRIKVKGSNWHIGLYQVSPGKYIPVYDFFGSQGEKLQEAIGKNGEKLKQAYAVALLKRVALQRGMSVSTTQLADGSIRMTFNGGWL